MPGLTDLKIPIDPPGNSPANAPRVIRIPRPQTMGLFVILITTLSFLAGRVRNEITLTLLGAIFLAVLVYCFVGLFFLGLAHRKRAFTISADLVTRQIRAGEEGELRLSRENFFCLPGTLIRYELKLETRDHRNIRRAFDLAGPDKGFSSFPVPLRGAYFGAFDELLLFDAMGFFRLGFPVPREQGPRLLAAPGTAENALPLSIRSGGNERRREVNYRKTDDLTENRPYVPGDDPRRINWKLYGHGGELYVREGESVPPPHSRLLILIDTQADPRLYSLEESRREIDLLCENARAALEELSQSGTEILLGYTGGALQHGEASALAFPAAQPLSPETEFPPAPEDRGILILALPRSFTGNTALDQFFASRPFQQEVDLIFLHSSGGKKAVDREEAGRACAAFYGRKNNVRARRIILG